MKDDINYEKKILTHVLNKVFHNYYNNHYIVKRRTYNNKFEVKLT